MAKFDYEQVQNELIQKFKQPLNEFYERRIIFWYDEDQEFTDQFKGFEIPDVELFILNGKNSFEAKKVITRDKKDKNFLVYCPLSYSVADKDWLIDIKLYSEEFRADRISIWMDEMSIPASSQMRELVKRYKKFFNAKDRREKFMKFKAPASAKELSLNVLAVITGADAAQSGSIIRTVLSAGLNKEENAVWQNLVNFEVDQAFLSMVQQGTGYQEEDPSLDKLAAHILLTASTRTMDVSYLAGLEAMISASHAALCYDIVSDWLHRDAEGLYAIAQHVEEELRLYPRFQKVPVQDFVDTEMFPCIHEVILEKLMTDISNDLVDPDQIDAIIEKRRTSAWYDTFRNYYEGIAQVSNLFRFYKTHGAGFHTVEPKKIWEDYTSEYYKMDTYYRYFHLSFQRSLMDSNPLLDDLFKTVASKVEGIYSNWFLGELGGNWTKMVEESLGTNGQIAGIEKQSEFYNNHVVSQGSRVFVIISDAMRYEVAVDLMKQLEQETHSKVKLSSCKGIFPTITKFGMAALLPHEKLSIQRSLSDGKTLVLADGMSTEAGNRDAVLKKKNPKSVALKYKDIIGMKRADRQALVKNMEVVYIYHDTIDESSHSDDTEVFEACDETIGEIKNLVKIIVNEFSGTNILITSDHGFLYTYSPLKEDSKVDKGSAEHVIESGRRYVIADKNYSSDYLMPVDLKDTGEEYEGFAPKENVRIKMSGGGMNFVHGGVSLQEMVVPIIEYHFIRKDSKEYMLHQDKYDTKPVEVALLSASRKISNLIFSLNFYQKQAVGATREAATYKLYFIDKEKNQISDIQRIIADKTSENNQDRTFRVSFSLKPKEYKITDDYYLVIADETGLQAPVTEEFQIDIAFADDFGF